MEVKALILGLLKDKYRIENVPIIPLIGSTFN